MAMTDKSENRVKLEEELKARLGGKLPAKLATLISGLNDDQLAQFIKRAVESRYSVQTVIPDSKQASSSWKRAAVYKFIYPLAGLVSGLICIIGGIILIVHHMIGSISWTAKVVGAESQISDAAAGAILFLVGLVLVSITSYTVRAKL